MRILPMIWLLAASLYAAPDAQINMLIDNVINASPETRYEKMNAFKLKMRELNAEQRSEALKALQSKAYPEFDPETASRSQTGGRQPDAGTASQQELRQQQYRMQQQSTPGGMSGNGQKQPQQQNMPR